MGAFRLDREHYAAFAAPTVRESRKVVKDRVWPELKRLADTLVPALSQLVGRPLHPHLAFQDGPVREAFAAFSDSPKRYRDRARFTLVVNRAGVQARVALGPDVGEGRGRVAVRVERETLELAKRFRSMAGVRSYVPALLPGNGNPGGDLVLDDQFWKELVGILRTPEGAVDIGFGWSASRARTLAQIEIITAFERLAPIYRLMDGAE
jgi:hypothetical protein